jgi:hypothetical protein
MKKIFYKLVCISAVCLLTPITVWGAQNTARIPNNPIDISDENDNGTILHHFYGYL